MTPDEMQFLGAFYRQLGASISAAPSTIARRTGFIPLALVMACAPPASPPVVVVAKAAPEQPSPPLAEAPCKPSPALPKPQIKPDRARIAGGLEPSLAAMVISDRSDLEARATPYLTRGVIWEMEHFGRAHPSYARIGTIDGEPSADLDTPEAFAAFARRAGLSLHDDTARRAYVMAYLEHDRRYVTLLESPSEIRYVVGRDVAQMKLDAETLELLGPMLHEEIARRIEVEDRIAPAIGPMCLRGSGPRRGTIHAIRRQRTLVRIDVTLEASGAVGVRETVLAEGVPVPVVVP